MRTQKFSVDAAALRLLRSQHGYATVSQLYDLGMSKDQIAERVRKRILVRHGYGVVGLDPPDRTIAARAMRGVLRIGGGAVACRWTAAELHGIDAPRSEQVHVVVHGDRRRRERDNVHVHRTRYLPDDHIVTACDVPSTSVPRTLVDCATDLDHWLALRMLDSVSASASLWGTIHHTAERMSNGRAGVRAIADVTAPDGHQRFRSSLERRAFDALRTHGLPEAEWNVVIHDDRGRVREVDMCFRPARLVVEFDGLRHHRARRQAQRDRETDRRLALAGWRVLRFTWWDVVRRPAVVANQIATAMMIA
jgi:predicted transcriptional regulator of viral defense system